MLKVTLPKRLRGPPAGKVERLKGSDSSGRCDFIQARASAVDVEEIDA
jgi:hypothetical protein